MERTDSDVLVAWVLTYGVRHNGGAQHGFDMETLSSFGVLENHSSAGHAPSDELIVRETPDERHIHTSHQAANHIVP